MLKGSEWLLGEQLSHSLERSWVDAVKWSLFQSEATTDQPGLLLRRGAGLTDLPFASV